MLPPDHAGEEHLRPAPGSDRLRAPGRCQIIAEAGTSHGGDLTKARELIAAAAEAGADTIKFQMVIADELVHPQTGGVDLPSGTVDLYRRFRSLERPVSFYQSLKAETEAEGLSFLCTPFGVQSVRNLARLGCPTIKVASPEVNHEPMLREIGRLGLTVILSTGVSLLADIERALRLLPKVETLLHCVTWYPAPPEEYNLRVLPALRTLFGLPMGVSDHSLDPVLVPSAAAALGAVAIEKHLTLSHDGAGLDDPIALEPDGFTRMVRAVRAIEEGDLSLEGLKEEYGRQLVEKVLGDGVKRLSPSEASNYRTTNRSLIAMVDLPAGAEITAENVGVLRSEKNLTPGLPPQHLKILTGRAVVRSVPAGTGLGWDDVLPAIRG